MADYKHYIRKNENDDIIKAFSDAFEPPKEGDICICETDSRHVMLNDEFNPQIEGMGVYLYKHVDEKVIKKAPEEMVLEVESLSEIKPLSFEERILALENAVKLLTKG